MIYGPGGYKYKDFLVIGTPIQVVLWILSIFLLTILDEKNWWIIWGVMFLTLMLVVGVRMFNLSSVTSRFRGKRNEEGVVDC